MRYLFILVIIAAAGALPAKALHAQQGTPNNQPAAEEYVEDQVRIKELADIEGLIPIHVRGIGLVVGLNESGDKGEAALQTLKNYLERHNIIVDESKLELGGYALVSVVAVIEPHSRKGDPADVFISAFNGAKSLKNGYLLSTPLYPSQTALKQDQKFAMAEGAVSLASDANSPTNGQIADGALVLQDLDFPFSDGESFTLVLRNPDAQTATNIYNALKEDEIIGIRKRPELHPVILDPKRIKVYIPESSRSNIVDFISRVQRVSVQVDVESKVMINTKTNTVSITGDVYVMPTTVVHKGIPINIVTPPVKPLTGVAGSIGSNKPGQSLKKLTEDLNLAGWGGEDLIAILLQLNEAGAIKAKVEVK